MSNLTSVSTFLLLQFSDIREMQFIHFLVFLAMYLMAVTGNLLIIIAVALDDRLHTPMYFFLFNLAMIDLGTISVIVPKSMAMSLKNDRSISYSGCVAQVFFYFFFASLDLVVLTIMAHDRYVAICNPLQYERIMHMGACLQMVVIGFMASLLYATIHTSGTFGTTFCSNIVNQFFCDISQLLKLSCSHINLVEVGLLVIGFGIGVGCFVFIIVSYSHIFTTVLRIPSVQGQKKAFSTCLPHLTVVSLLILSSFLAYGKPSTGSSSTLDIAFAVVYTIIPPMLNPFIYSMRNKEIKSALWKLFKFTFISKRLF
ncbi:olfactory receptor 14A16-like [Sceloporus undulatus]|uniref:olfactory receptor 14A16-like n=1 Tax=Sceloporus undulatus TaxID=8520 RepID=UPI001C4BAAFB|nr:olfactory receptor 14A16-like [Sceloporus undulatus]